jgi:hypothetical protein
MTSHVDSDSYVGTWIRPNLRGFMDDRVGDLFEAMFVIGWEHTDIFIGDCVGEPVSETTWLLEPHSALRSIIESGKLMMTIIYVCLRFRLNYPPGKENLN